MSRGRGGFAPAAVRRLAAPAPVDVGVGPDGRPSAVRGTPVEAVVEEWVVEDRWWTESPLRRRYFELVLVDGRDVVVFRDLIGGGWLGQRD